MASTSCVLVALFYCLLAVLVPWDAEARVVVPAIFVFGDSTVDVGNNNFLSTREEGRADFPQYGIDFPSSMPTGRFSNGFNTADQLAQLLGFEMSPPAFLSLTSRRAVRSQMFKGINFASGGSGLADHTGRLVAGQVIPMSLQLEYFATVVHHMYQSAGSKRAASLLSRSIFFISTGSNDMFEYSFSPRNDSEFLLALVASYKYHLKALYRLGAKKFSIVSIPPLGCTPSQRLRRLAQTGTQGCFDPLNNLSLLSYPLMAAMLREISQELPGMHYSLGDAFAMVSFVFANPRTNEWSFTELEAACCGAGPFGASGCNQTVPLCANRDDHLFWDANHPTQAVSGIAAQTLFAGNHKFVDPINVRTLALL